MRRLPSSALVVLSLLAACGEEGNLNLRLLRAGFEDPYAGVDRFQIRVLDTDLKEVERLTVDDRSGGLDVGVLASGKRWLDVRGLSGGVMTARGQSRLLDLSSGSNAEELVPFSSLSSSAAVPAAAALKPSFAVDAALNEWAASPSMILDGSTQVSGASVTASDLRAEVMLAWDQGKLYLALRVSDDCPAMRVGHPAGACGKATATERVFLGIDGADDGGSSFGADDLWIEMKPTGLWVRRGAVTQSELHVMMGAREDPPGWVMEASLDLKVLGRSTLSATDRMGFDIIVVDEDPGEAAPAVLRWSSRSVNDPVEITPPGDMGTIGFGMLKTN